MSDFLKGRRFALVLSAATVFLLCGNLQLVNSEQTNDSVRRPNVVWIVAEDLSQDLECYGNEIVRTPNINSLCEKGAKFTHTFTSAAVCAPSRTALALGLSATSVDAHHMRYPDEMMNALPNDVIPLNELFRRGGYTTAHIHDFPANKKLDWSFARSNLTEFDLNSWSDLASQEAPFFALVNLKQTHRPFVQDDNKPIDPKDVAVPAYYPDVPTVRQDLSDYYETIQQLDREIGQVLEQMRALGLMENTIIMFFSDHGRPFPRAKNGMYDSGTRVPFIVKFPTTVSPPSGFQAGMTDRRLLSSLDIVATSLDLADIEIPERMEGKSFYGDDTIEFERDFVVSHLDRIGGTNFKSRSLRTKQYRFTINFNRDFSTNEGSTGYRKAMHPIYHVLHLLHQADRLNTAQQTLTDPLPEFELYDLEKDPEEVKNLAGNPKFHSVLMELKSQLLNWMEETNDFGMKPDSEPLQKAFSDYRKQSHRSRYGKIKDLEARVRLELEQSGHL